MIKEPRIHFVDALKQWNSECPHRKAIQVVNSKCTIAETLTYSQLWEETGRLAMHFLKEGIQQGDRVMIVYPNTAQVEYLVAFVACIRVGVVPVSIYPPNPQKIDQDLIKLEHFVSNAGATRAITTSEYKRFVQMSCLTKKWAIPAKYWLSTDSLLKKKIQVDPDKVSFQAKDEDLVFIQYTSGSTGFIILT
jgi:acyl-CoA synthetase (AMP-forming)/AMP-acid ligase II